MTHDFDRAAQRPINVELSERAQQVHLSALSELRRPTARSAHRRRRTVRISVAVGVAILGIGAGTAAAFGAFDSPVTDHGTAHCYTTADLGRPDNHIDFGVAVAANSSTAIGDAAAQAMTICTVQWAKGRFSLERATFPDDATGTADHPVPPLVVCVLDNGQVAVFPGTDAVCTSLGLGKAIL